MKVQEDSAMRYLTPDLHATKAPPLRRPSGESPTLRQKSGRVSGPNLFGVARSPLPPPTLAPVGALPHNPSMGEPGANTLPAASASTGAVVPGSACLTLEGAFERVKTAFLHHHPHGDLDLLERAFKVGRAMHAKQARRSGEPSVLRMSSPTTMLDGSQVSSRPPPLPRTLVIQPWRAR